MDDALLSKFICSPQIYRSCASAICGETRRHQGMVCIHYCFKSQELYVLQPFGFLCYCGEVNTCFWIKSVIP